MERGNMKPFFTTLCIACVHMKKMDHQCQCIHMFTLTLYVYVQNLILQPVLAVGLNGFTNRRRIARVNNCLGTDSSLSEY